MTATHEDIETIPQLFYQAVQQVMHANIAPMLARGLSKMMSPIVIPMDTTIKGVTASSPIGDEQLSSTVMHWAMFHRRQN
jgi:hypothetical protein